MAINMKTMELHDVYIPPRGSKDGYRMQLRARTRASEDAIFSGDFDWYGNEAMHMTIQREEMPETHKEAEGEKFKLQRPQDQRDRDIWNALPRHLRPLGGK